MDIQVSLSAVPKYTDRQQDLMRTMLHDKGHVLDSNRKDSDLEELTHQYASSPKMPLYRGLYEQELMALFKQSKLPAIHLSRYLSFSEDFDIAKGFSKAGKTDTVVEILPGAKNKAFNYWSHTRDLIMAADLDKEFGGDEEERDMIIEGLDSEREWIYPFDFKFKIVQSRSVKGVQVITIQPV